MSRSLIALYVFGLSVSLLLIATGAGLFGGDKSCLDTDHGFVVCAASDMAKITRDGAIKLEHQAYDLSRDQLTLDAARDETIAFQLLLKRKNSRAPSAVTITIGDLVTDQKKRLVSSENINLFRAHYHWVEHGGYAWGPESKVLPWPDFYPDALIPSSMACLGNTTKIVDEFPLPEKAGENQSVWVDVYIPRDHAAGVYKTQISIRAADINVQIPISLNVWNVTLPDRPTIDAVGEIYDAYKLEGAGNDPGQKSWKAMAQCYQQLAHQHRMVFIERLTVKPDQEQAWKNYNDVFAPMLDGQLFSKAMGYTGPGEELPVAIWRTPWPQIYNARVRQPLTDQEINNVEVSAKKWREIVDQNHWDNSRFFAYIFDEVDGATDEDELGDVSDDYITMVHTQMDRVQKAIDKGMGDQSVDLIWTSHTDPQTWQGIPGEDLKDIIRLWSPSANSANVTYLADRKKAGSTIWFYHSGHPAVGIHSINASGIEMRSWGVITARYNFDGHFMWALNLGDEDQPYHYPSYKKTDDRFGNGTLVYPGNKLDTIGLKAVPGPIPSMRLKAWRRGLQDAELIFLARKAGYEKEVDQRLKKLIPDALSEGWAKASWSEDAEDWIEFHRWLLEKASVHPAHE